MVIRLQRWQRLFFIGFCSLLFYCSWIGLSAHLGLRGDLAQATIAVAPASTTGDLVQQGIQQYEQGQFQAAIDLWQQALNLNPLTPRDRAKIQTNLAMAWEKIGQLETSLHLRQAAIQFYRTQDRQDDRRQLAQLLADQAQTFNDLGQHRQAKATVTESLALAKNLNDALTPLVAQVILGNTHLALGDLALAQSLLEQSQQQSRTLTQSSLSDQDASAIVDFRVMLYNSLGNLYSGLANRELEQFRTAAAEAEPTASQLQIQARRSIQAAIAAYQESIRLGSPQTRSIQASALLNLHRLLQQHPSESVDAPIRQNALRPQLLAILQAMPDSQEKAYDLINFAVQLFPISWHQANFESGEPTLLAQRIQLLETALALAQKIGDRRAESYAWGSLGQTYEWTDLAKALQMTRTAQQLAQSVKAPESLYRWLWQAGRILKRQGQIAQAIVAYEEAVENLQQIRADLIVANRDLQFDFRDAVEPVYRDLIGLLLEREHQQATAGLVPTLARKQVKPSDDRTLDTALNVLEFLKLAELQNFFGDECVQVAQAMAEWQFSWQRSPRDELIADHPAAKSLTVAENPSQPNALSLRPDTLVIYSVILPQKTEIILSTANQSILVPPITLTQQQMEQAVNQFRLSLEDRNSGRYHQTGRQMYDLLIRPLESYLATLRPRQLVFIHDGVLRKIPMAALFDGEHFLVEKYALAITPSLALTNSQPMSVQRANALILGLTEAQRGFPALPYVQLEANKVHELLGGKKLLDKEFTLESLQQSLSQFSHGIIHIATHGKFGINNANTFLVGHDQEITIDALENSLRLRRTNQPVDLLTLSACQTATGDSRSALGIAGVAVRAGVRSALATLWYINDESTVFLIRSFYHELVSSRLPRAEAIRQAQIKMIRSDEWEHPSIWSPFILIGNWL